MQQRVEGEGKYIKAKTYLMRMSNNTPAMYLNLGLLDFIKIAITYMNIYVFSHYGKKSIAENLSNLELIYSILLNLPRFRESQFM